MGGSGNSEQGDECDIKKTLPQYTSAGGGGDTGSPHCLRLK